MNKNQRLFLIFLSMTITLLCMGAIAYALNVVNPKVTLNGKNIAHAKTIDGKIYVPLDAIANQLGAKVQYDKKTKTYAVRTTVVTPTPFPTNTPKEIKLLPTPNATLTILSTPTMTSIPITTATNGITPTITIEKNTTLSSTVDPTLAKVIRVVDGDTFVVEWNGKEERVRLIGVDTPETVDPNQPIQPYGKEASDYTKTKLNGQIIRLELDIDHRDRYGRLLAYAWLNDQLFNAELIRNGYAVLLTISPNVKYAERFATEQKEAREARRGLWGNTILNTPMPAPTTSMPIQMSTPNPITPTDAPIDSRVNINIASQKELENLPGIGPTLALRIIEYRNSNRFDTTQEIIAVKGIGDATFRKLESLIRVD